MSNRFVTGARSGVSDPRRVRWIQQHRPRSIVRAPRVVTHSRRSTMRSTASTLLALLLATNACGPAAKDGAAADDDDSSGDDDDDDDDRAYPIDAGICGAQSEEIGLVNLGDPPDLLIVLDRSGSMSSP